MKKTGYQNDNLPNLGHWFSWGLNVEAVTEWFFVTGHIDERLDGSQHFPNDPVAQTRFILEQMEVTFSQAGYARDNIVCINWSVTKEVTEEQTAGILGEWAEYVAGVEPKPSGGSWKRIHGLFAPDALIELELILAR